MTQISDSDPSLQTGQDFQRFPACHNASTSSPMYHVINGAYLLLGLVILCGNLLIILAIWRTKKLHKKEFSFPAGLAVADLSYGSFYTIASIRRTLLLVNGQATELATVWDCMKHEPYNLLFFFGGQSMTLMLVLISVDRCLAMFSVSLYMKLNKRYALTGILGVFVYVTCSTLGGLVASYTSARELKHCRFCYSVWSVPAWYVQYNFGHLILCGLASVFLYVFATVLLRVQGRSSKYGSIKREYEKRQAKLTRMLLYVVISTLFLFDIPMILLALDEAILDKFSPLLAWISMINSANNILIYVIKNRDMRGACIDILTCKSVRTRNISCTEEYQSNYQTVLLTPIRQKVSTRKLIKGGSTDISSAV